MVNQTWNRPFESELLTTGRFSKRLEHFAKSFWVNCARALIESLCGMGSATVQMRSSLDKLSIGVLLLVIGYVVGQQNSLFSVSLLLIWLLISFFLNFVTVLLWKHSNWPFKIPYSFGFFLFIQHVFVFFFIYQAFIHFICQAFICFILFFKHFCHTKKIQFGS